MAAVKNHFHDELETRRVADDLCIPVEWLQMNYDNWTQDYRDHFNDVFVTQSLGRKMWTVASRGAGNVTVIHSRHRDVDHALAAARGVIVARRVA